MSDTWMGMCWHCGRAIDKDQPEGEPGGIYCPCGALIGVRFPSDYEPVLDNFEGEWEPL